MEILGFFGLFNNEAGLIEFVFENSFCSGFGFKSLQALFR